MVLFYANELESGVSYVTITINVVKPKVSGKIYRGINYLGNEKKCEIDLKQMYHCRQCREDAIGMLSDDRSADFRNSCGSNGCESKAGTSEIQIKGITEKAVKLLETDADLA